jgi:hypothetical protein
MGVFSFDELPRRMNKLGTSITQGVSKLAQDVAIGIGATVVDTTKVDTGKARSNWRASISAPASGTIPPYSPGNKLGIGETANAGAAKAQQKQAISRFDASKHTSIFITNNVPYIGALNDGSSVHAPGNMVELGLQTGRAILQAKAGKVLGKR